MSSELLGRTVTVLAGSCLFLWPLANASAQEKQEQTSVSNYVDAANGTNVSQLVDMAIARNADLLSVRQRITEAQGLLRQSAFRLNPSIDTTVNVGPAIGVPGPREVSVGYNHIFELGHKRKLRIEVSERGLELARLGVADQERQLRADVGNRYAEAMAAARNFEIIDQQLRLSQDIFRITEARVKQGEAPTLDQALVQVELGRLQSDRILFENQVQRVIFAIRPLIGMDSEPSLRLGGRLIAQPVNVSLDDAVGKAIAQRPDLQAARMEEHLREAETRSARAEAIPNLIASGKYARSNDNLGQFGFNTAGTRVPIIDLDHTVTFGVSVILPLRNRNQGLIQAAVARADGARLRRKFVEQVVTQEVRSAYTRYEAAQRALKVYDQNVINRSLDNLRIIQAAFNAGELRLFDVINEQRRLTDTQRTYTEVLRESYVSIVELERAVGGPLQ